MLNGKVMASAAVSESAGLASGTAERIAAGAPLASFDRKTLYTPGARGYIDYPRWGGAA